ncbi:MAG: P-loop NTPase family protein [Planctomycetota bacterium]
MPRDAAHQILCEPRAPRAGDLVLARIDALGHHRGLQLPSGRRKTLFVGDEVVVAYGDRYASNQFEAVVPNTLGPCQLVAGGGVAAKALSWHSKIGRGPTQITPIGLLAGADGQPTNLRDHALPSVDQLVERCPTAVVVVGTAMDSGKTTAAAFLVKGLTLTGVRAGYAKITGTGAGGDTWFLTDAGADPVLDFTDVGFVSTYRVPHAEVERILVTLVTHLGKAGADAIVLEVADGVLQPETAALLTSPVFRRVIGGILFTACESMGVAAGHDWLKSHKLPVVGLSGVLTASPLQCREASLATGLPIFSREELAQTSTAMKILGWAEEHNHADGGADVCAG